MDFQEFQRWVLSYYEKRGWKEYGPFIRVGFLMEETGELARAVRAIEIGRDRPDENQPSEDRLKQELTEELGDVLGNLILLAHLYQLDLEEVVKAHKEKLINRYPETE